MKEQHILEIIERKKQGQDCTEQESAEIKGWLRDTIIMLESDDIPTLNEIQLLFPLEYGEWAEQDEKETPIYTVNIETNSYQDEDDEPTQVGNEVLPEEIMLQGDKFVDTQTGEVLAIQYCSATKADRICKAVNNYSKLVEENERLKNGVSELKNIIAKWEDVFENWMMKFE